MNDIVVNTTIGIWFLIGMCFLNWFLGLIAGIFIGKIKPHQNEETGGDK